MLRGMCTFNLFAEDLAEATRWYTELLGVAPYFEVPDGYVEFRIGDRQDELGIVNAKYRPHPVGLGGVVTYWAVDDVQATFDRLLAMGAKEHDAVRERGPGFVTASVVDPFGNILGVMYNAHYLEILA